MKRFKPARPLILVVALLTLHTMPAFADPPSRVGRISLAEGAISLHHGDDPQWSPAGLNYPLIAGDSIWTDPSARGEIEIGGAELRLDGATEVAIVRLDDEATSLRIDQGAVNLAVRFLPIGGLQLLTSVGQLDIRQPGEYHIDAGRPGGPPTQLVLAVMTGEAHFAGPRGTTELHYGQGAMSPPDQSSLTVVAIYPTPFDQWAESRALSFQVAQSSQYVSTEVTGYQDLDGYGRWETVPDYGTVWFPTRIEAGWAPYRYGHWAFVQPWGWTWIDEAPWGFAPFHYGRWAEFEGRWAWVPGARGERPCYAPALVAFIGGGPGVGGIGVGWVPLGPREVFHPYYQVSDRYLININRPHVTNVTNITQVNVTNVTVNNYANHGAMTSVTAASFSGGQAVHRNLVTLPQAQPGQPQRILTNLNHLPPPTAAVTAPAPAPRPNFAPAAAQSAPPPRQGITPQAAPAPMPQQHAPVAAPQPLPQPVQAPRPAPPQPMAQPAPQPPHPVAAPPPVVQQPRPAPPPPPPPQRAKESEKPGEKDHR